MRKMMGSPRYGSHPDLDVNVPPPNALCYDDWTHELEKLAEDQGRESPPEEDWREYFEKGSTPREALDRFYNL